MPARLPRRAPLALESLEARAVPAGFVVTGTDAGSVARVRVFTDADGNDTYETLASTFKPFGTATAGVRVALGDFDGDQNDELVCATGVGYGRINIYDLNADGTVGDKLETFVPWAGFTGGLFVACGDLDGDGRDELAVARGSKGSSISIYSDNNFNGTLADGKVDAFNPWAGFQGGVRLAFGNTNNVAGDELIVGRGPGGPATVAVYTDSDFDRAVSDQAKVEEFNAFGGGYTWGITVAAGPVAGAGNDGAELLVARDKGPGIVRVFSDANTDGRVGNDPLFASFNVYGNWQGGVRVASGDTDASGTYHEVVVGPGPGGGTLGIWDNPGSNAAFAATQATPGYGPAYKGGFFVAFGQVKAGNYYSPAAVALPDLSLTSASVVVPAGAGTIKDLNVSLGITHTYDGDLTVTLKHVPTGTTVILFSNVAGTGDGFSVTLDDESGTDIGTSAGVNGQTLFGTFNPEGSAFLSAFDGEDASGEWILTVNDTSGGDFGTLNSWGLNLTY